MTRFRQDNTEGYSDADLTEMNEAFLSMLSRCAPDIVTVGYETDDLARKSLEDYVAETIQFRYDRGERGSKLAS